MQSFLWPFEVSAQPLRATLVSFPRIPSTSHLSICLLATALSAFSMIVRHLYNCLLRLTCRSVTRVGRERHVPRAHNRGTAGTRELSTLGLLFWVHLQSCQVAKEERKAAAAPICVFTLSLACFPWGDCFWVSMHGISGCSMCVFLSLHRKILLPMHAGEEK